MALLRSYAQAPQSGTAAITARLARGGRPRYFDIFALAAVGGAVSPTQRTSADEDGADVSPDGTPDADSEPAE